MSDKSQIEWTDATWNPTTGCDRVSPGCAHCYALTLAKRLKGMGSARYQKDGGRASGPGFGLTLHPDVLSKPLSWKKPRRIFVNSMSDLFHEDVPFEFIDRVFAVMALSPQHTFQLLTKRPERMREYMTQERDTFEWPLRNCWLGVTVENQRWADERIPILLDTPAAVRFVSVEPMLEALDLTRLQPKRLQEMNHPYDPYITINGLTGLVGGMDEFSFGNHGVDWVIVGGESGPKHRPFDPDWARSIVRQCAEAGVACFVKQLGGLRPGTRLEDLPEDLRVREFPYMERERLMK